MPPAHPLGSSASLSINQKHPDSSTFYLQAIDLQRVLDGEKAQRTDATRRLTELDKQAARLRRVEAPDEASLAELQRERAGLEQRKLQHSAQVRAIGDSAAMRPCRFGIRPEASKELLQPSVTLHASQRWL